LGVSFTFTRLWFTDQCITAAAEGRELYRFSVDLAKLALRIAERHGTSGEKWSGKEQLLLPACIDYLLRSRAQVLFCAMVSGFDSVHIRANLPRLEEAIKYGQSAGDR
jgi:hypothetical protein